MIFETKQRESSLKLLNESLMMAFNELASESEETFQVFHSFIKQFLRKSIFLEKNHKRKGFSSEKTRK